MSEVEQLEAQLDKYEEWCAEKDRTITALRAELERLTKQTGDLLAERASDWQRLLDASDEAGMPFWGCDTPEAMADKINDLKADAALGANLRKCLAANKDGKFLLWDPVEEEWIPVYEDNADEVIQEAAGATEER